MVALTPNPRRAGHIRPYPMAPDDLLAGSPRPWCPTPSRRLLPVPSRAPARSSRTREAILIHVGTEPKSTRARWVVTEPRPVRVAHPVLPSTSNDGRGSTAATSATCGSRADSRSTGFWDERRSRKGSANKLTHRNLSSSMTHGDSGGPAARPGNRLPSQIKPRRGFPVEAPWRRQGKGRGQHTGGRVAVVRGAPRGGQACASVLPARALHTQSKLQQTAAKVIRGGTGGQGLLIDAAGAVSNS